MLFIIETLKFKKYLQTIIVALLWSISGRAKVKIDKIVASGNFKLIKNNLLISIHIYIKTQTNK